MSDSEKRQSYIRGLREIADFLEANAAFPVPSSDLDCWVSSNAEPDELKRYVDVFVHGARGTVRKDGKSDSDYMSIIRSFGSVHLGLTFRKDLLGCRKVTVERTVSEEQWQCGPILDAIQENET